MRRILCLFLAFFLAFAPSVQALDKLGGAVVHVVNTSRARFALGTSPLPAHLARLPPAELALWLDKHPDAIARLQLPAQPTGLTADQFEEAAIAATSQAHRVVSAALKQIPIGTLPTHIHFHLRPSPELDALARIAARSQAVLEGAWPTLSDFEYIHILRAVQETGSIALASRHLNIDQATISRRLKRYGLSQESIRVAALHSKSTTGDFAQDSAWPGLESARRLHMIRTFQYAVRVLEIKKNVVPMVAELFGSDQATIYRRFEVPITREEYARATASLTENRWADIQSPPALVSFLRRDNTPLSAADAPAPRAAVGNAEAVAALTALRQECLQLRAEVADLKQQLASSAAANATKLFDTLEATLRAAGHDFLARNLEAAENNLEELGKRIGIFRPAELNVLLARYGVSKPTETPRTAPPAATTPPPPPPGDQKSGYKFSDDAAEKIKAANEPWHRIVSLDEMERLHVLWVFRNLGDPKTAADYLKTEEAGLRMRLSNYGINLSAKHNPKDRVFSDLPIHLAPRVSLKDARREYLLYILKICNKDIDQAAERLGIHSGKLERLLEEEGILVKVK